MNKRIKKLPETELELMLCLWDAETSVQRSYFNTKFADKGWSDSTVLTMLRRLEAKGAVAGDTEGEVKTFRPLIAREEVAVHETKSLLDRAYKGSLSLLVSSLTKKQSLPQKEIDELYAILREMEGKHGD